MGEGELTGFEIRVGRLVRIAAYAGGIVLVALTAITVASIFGRIVVTMANASDAPSWHAFLTPLLRAVGGAFTALGARPVPGDYELVEGGAGFAVFAFMGWAVTQRAHATVDLFAPFFANRFNRFMDLVSDLLILGVALFIGWRHWIGTLEKMANGETTFILQYPNWYSYALSMFGAVVFILAALASVIRSWRDWRANSVVAAAGAVH
jgi:TRAP-type C4-dicarboxylate transport system permease small subunit